MVRVVRVERGSPAWQLGLRPGDLITAVHRTRVRNVEELEKAARAGGRGILLHLRRGGAALYLYAQ